MYVIPAEGLTVPDPVLRDHLPATGRDVEPSEFWTRRFLDQDVSNGPEAFAAARKRATRDRDAALSVAEKARKAVPADDADPAARQAAAAALLAAESALAGAEAVLAEVEKHAPPPADPPPAPKSSARAAAPTGPKE